MVHWAWSILRKVHLWHVSMGISAYCSLFHLNKTILCLFFFFFWENSSNLISIPFGHEIWLHLQEEKRKKVKRKQSILPHNGIGNGNGSNKVTESQKKKGKIRKWKFRIIIISFLGNGSRAKWEKMFRLWSPINSKNEPKRCFSFSYSSSSSGSTSSLVQNG